MKILTGVVLLVFALLLTEPSSGAISTNSPESITLSLKRGKFEVLRYFANSKIQKGTPKSLIVFGSGSGGWSYWEDRGCRKLQGDGNEVLGIDFALYARSDYDLVTLEEDYQKIVAAGQPNGTTEPLPVILGGWSTGAEQSVAVASGPNLPSGLTGLLLISPGSEGGYGEFATSYVLLSAPRSKVFPLASLAPKLKSIRIVQWHAEFDPLDSRTWLSCLKTPHSEFDFPNSVHDYQNACPEFLKQLCESVSWILSLPAPRSSAIEVTIPKTVRSCPS